jgi:hypothetical protein
MSNFLLNIRALWMRIPEPVAKALRDAAVGAFTVVVALNLAIPGSLDEAKAEAVTVFAVVVPAIVAVLRVELLPWIVDQMFARESS